MEYLNKQAVMTKINGEYAQILKSNAWIERHRGYYEYRGKLIMLYELDILSRPELDVLLKVAQYNYSFSG